MKRQNILLLLGLFLFVSTSSKAQIEIKTNPVSFLFKNFPVKGEYLITPDWGAEIGAKTGWSNYTADNGTTARLKNYGASLAVKHYFIPSARGGDRFYALLYDKYRYWEGTSDGPVGRSEVTRNALGLGLGYKWVSRKNFIVETAIGGGKTTYNKVDNTDLAQVPLLNLDVYWRLDIGYRF